MVAQDEPSPLFILYGSATGNAEHIAKDLAATYEVLLKNPDAVSPFPSVVCCELDKFKKNCLPIWEKEGPTKHGVIVICSTTGNGDAPENAGRFVRFIKRKTTVASMPFQHCNFAILGLGDTNYDKFCESGKTLDKKLEELGGTRVQPLACADEATGLEDVVEPWVGTILKEICNACHGSSVPTETQGGKMQPLTNGKENGVAKPVETDNTVSSGVETLRSLLGITDTTKPIWQVDAKALPSISASRSSCELVVPEEEGGEITKVRSDSIADSHSDASSAGFHYNLNRPFESTLLKARYLTQTSTDAAKEVAKILESAAATDFSPYDDASLQQASKVFDRHFPLTTASHADDAERNGKRVIELTLSLPDDYTLEYSPGDSLGLVVENTAEAVQFVLNMFQKHHNILPSQKMTIDENHPITVEEAVRRHFDISAPIKNKRTLHSIAQFATDPDEACALQLLASKTSEGDKLFQTYVDEQRLTMVDILREFPSTQSISMPGLLGMLPCITPRYYSVSSSPMEHKKLSLTVAFSVVDYVTPSLLVHNNNKEEERGLRRVHGLATRFLEITASPLLAGGWSSSSSSSPAAARQKIKIFPKPTAEFRMPSTLATPLVLIGPGTGIAPFMGFLSHRRALATSSDSKEAAQTVVEGTWRGGFDVNENELSIHDQRDASGLKVGVDFRSQQGIGTVDLFFGCRHQDHDWLYREEMEAMVEDGVLSKLHTAFSRDGHKQYVQDIMKSTAESERLAKLIVEKKAAVYVCGDGNAMAKDVKEAVVELLSRRLDGGIDEAKAYLESMKKESRFLLDIWS